jgi:hypothetical protein
MFGYDENYYNIYYYTYVYINDDSGFYSRSEVLGSHTEYNPI